MLRDPGPSTFLVSDGWFQGIAGCVEMNVLLQPFEIATQSGHPLVELRMLVGWGSASADRTLRRLSKLGGVIANSVFEYDYDISDV